MTLLEDDNFDMIFVLIEMLEKLSCSLCTERITVFKKMDVLSSRKFPEIGHFGIVNYSSII